MTTDERIDALLARHEALAQQVELLQLHLLQSDAQALADQTEAQAQTLSVVADALLEHDYRLKRLDGGIDEYDPRLDGGEAEP